jgi:hypothetical protein
MRPWGSYIVSLFLLCDSSFSIDHKLLNEGVPLTTLNVLIHWAFCRHDPPPNVVRRNTRLVNNHSCQGQTVPLFVSFHVSIFLNKIALFDVTFEPSSRLYWSRSVKNFADLPNCLNTIVQASGIKGNSK